jgi:hypothetical protein
MLSRTFTHMLTITHIRIGAAAFTLAEGDTTVGNTMNVNFMATDSAAASMDSAVESTLSTASIAGKSVTTTIL